MIRDESAGWSEDSSTDCESFEW